LSGLKNASSKSFSRRWFVLALVVVIVALAELEANLSLAFDESATRTYASDYVQASERFSLYVVAVPLLVLALLRLRRSIQRLMIVFVAFVMLASLAVASVRIVRTDRAVRAGERIAQLAGLRVEKRTTSRGAFSALRSMGFATAVRSTEWNSTEGFDEVCRLE
jgi:hypothetical protein